MAYYYVKSGGSATGNAGRYASAQTGSFATLGAANYYNSITAAIAATTAPTSSDEIRVSSSHNFDNGASTITYGFSATGTIPVISVSDTNCDQYSAGAKEQTNSTIQSNGKSAWYGVTLDTNQYITVGGNGSGRFENCTLLLTTTSDYIGGTLDGAYMELVNCTVDCANTDNGIWVRGGSEVYWIGGSLTAATSITNLLPSAAIDGGGRITVIGVDLSEVSTSLLAHGTTQAADDHLDVRIHGCKLASGITYFSGTLTNPGTSILVTNSSDTSAAAEYQFYYQDYYGKVQDDTVIYRNETTTYPSGQKTSLKCTTNSVCNSNVPFAFDIPARYCALSSASTDTIRVYFAVTNTVTLTNKNLWAEVIYADGTNKNVYNRVTSRITDIIGTGTAWTDDSGSSTWKATSGSTDLSGYNEYRMDIATSGDVGADCVPTVRIYVGEPSVTVYFDPTLGLVA